MVEIYSIFIYCHKVANQLFLTRLWKQHKASRCTANLTWFRDLQKHTILSRTHAHTQRYIMVSYCEFSSLNGELCTFTGNCMNSESKFGIDVPYTYQNQFKSTVLSIDNSMLNCDNSFKMTYIELLLHTWLVPGAEPIYPPVCQRWAQSRYRGRWGAGLGYIRVRLPPFGLFIMNHIQHAKK